MSRLSRVQFGCAHVDPAVPVTDLPEGPDALVSALSSAQSDHSGPHDSLCGALVSSANLSEDGDSCRIVRSRTNHSAIDALRRYLSSENVMSDCPLVYSPTALRSLFYCAESRNQLGLLGSEMLTLLIGLFGSLSLDPRISVVYRVSLAPRLLETPARKTYWAFILKVGKYKSERGLSLQDSDRFWLMCAELASIPTDPPSELISGKAYSAILRARTHYHIIRRHSRHPGAHAYYLDTLIAARDPRLLDFAACDLSFLLRTHRVCHLQLQRILYRLVIQHGGLLSSRSQQAILTALWRRVFQGADETSYFAPQNTLSNATLDGCNLNATSIARSLSSTLFGSTDHLSSDKSVNSFSHLFSVFSPTYGLPLRWNSLVFLSIFKFSEVSLFNEIRWMNDDATPPVALCWQVIFGLAAVEKLSCAPSSAPGIHPTPTEDTLKAIRALYQLWLPVAKSGRVALGLTCAVAISFFRAAGVLADATLFQDCQGLYRVEDHLEARQVSARKFLAAEHIAAATRVQGALTNMVLTALEAFSPDLEQQSQVLITAAQVLAPIDPSLAYTLYIAAQERGTVHNLGVTYTLAMSFARRGELRRAFFLLNQARLSPEERGILVSVIARSFRENPQTRHPQSVLVAIVDELAALYHSCLPPEHFRGHLEQLFVVLARHGRGSQLLTVVLSIFGKLPSFFQQRFFVRYCRALIRHRQFTTASKLIGAITVAHPKIIRSLSILADRVATQTKAFRMFKRITPVRGPASLRISSRLRRCPHAGPSLGRSLQELLQSRRVLAAKHIFASAAATVPPGQCTVLGNILLHGVSRQPKPRNGRRVRKVLVLFDNLVKNHGFRPDRVTVNILINVMIGWQSAFNSPRLRELFDQLVGSGYPAADFSPLHPPFGAQQTGFSGSSGFSKLSPFVSFEKHSRPLFKMFIKAFYLCNDVEAARKVVGILKVEEYKNAVAKQTRQRARTMGRIKAARGNVVSSYATVSSID